MSYRRRDDDLAFVLLLVSTCVFYAAGRAANGALRRLRWIGPRLPMFLEPLEGEEFRTLAHLTRAYPWEAFGGREAYHRARADRAFAWSLIDAGLPEQPLSWTDRVALTVIGAFIVLPAIIIFGGGSGG